MIMEFPHKLNELILASYNNGSSAASTVESLSDWNADMDSFWNSSLNGSKEMVVAGDCTKTIDISVELIKDLVDLLRNRILNAASLKNEQNSELGGKGKSNCEKFDDEVEKSISSAIMKWKSIDFDDNYNDKLVELLLEYIRAGSNLIRWYLQIFLSKNRFCLPMPTAKLQTNSMLNLYIFLIDQNSKVISKREQELARYSSLLLFYATYSPNPVLDDSMQIRYKYLLSSKQNFLKIVLKILVRNISIPLVLSLVRNIHNLLVSDSAAKGAILNISINLADDYGLLINAPWCQQWIKQNKTEFGFLALILDILTWTVHENDTNPFPGKKADTEDRRADLVVEILGWLYALDCTKKLFATTDISDDRKSNNTGSIMSQFVLKILALPNDRESKAYQCKLSTVSLIMDADPSLSHYLIENVDAVTSLLDLLEIQVLEVINETKVDNSAAAGLVPIMAVLEKFSKYNDDFKRITKNRIFPPADEDTFWNLALEQEHKQGMRKQKNTVNGIERIPKNLSPIYAPKNTLRFRMILLMTWSESHIKRFSSEFLFTLCGNDAREFILRTGFGNAIALLNQRRIVQAPNTNTH